MTFKTPLEIHQRNLGMDLSVEELEAACEIARQNISEALEGYSEKRNSLTVKVDLSEAQWNVVKDIIVSELKESGWDMWHQRVVQPNGAKLYIRVDIASMKDDRQIETVPSDLSLFLEIFFLRIPAVVVVCGFILAMSLAVAQLLVHLTSGSMFDQLDTGSRDVPAVIDEVGD